MLRQAVAIIYNPVSCETRGKQLIDCTYVPDDKLVIVLTTERSQILLISREMEVLDEHFMELEAM